MKLRVLIAGAATLCAACASVAEDAAMERLRVLQGQLPEQAIEVEAAARQILAEAPTPSVERGATGMLAEALADQGRCDELLPGAEQAIAAADAAPFDWRFAFALTYECENYDRAAVLLGELNAHQPDDIAHLPSRMVYRTITRTRDTSLIAAVVENWQPDDPAIDKSDLRLTLVRAHLANGNQEEAVAAARQMVELGASDLGALVVFTADRDFDPVIAADPAAFEFRRMADRFVANGFANYTANPRRLSSVHALAETLSTLGRYDEALALVEDALSRPNDFSDRAANLNWIYQMRANLLSRLGRDDEALTDLATGAEQGEDGRVNVSQRLNRAGYLLSRDQPEEALAAAEAVRPEHLSPYGRAVRRGIIICSNAELGREAEMRAALEEAASHGSDSYNRLQDAALCAEDYDLAAQAFMQRLRSPAERRSAILEVQGFAEEGPQQQWLDRHPVYSRPDVREAIMAAAHLRTYPIRRVWF